MVTVCDPLAKCSQYPRSRKRENSARKRYRTIIRQRGMFDLDKSAEISRRTYPKNGASAQWWALSLTFHTQTQVIFVCLFRFFSLFRLPVSPSLSPWFYWTHFYGISVHFSPSAQMLYLVRTQQHALFSLRSTDLSIHQSINVDVLEID